MCALDGHFEICEGPAVEPRLRHGWKDEITQIKHQVNAHMNVFSRNKE